VKASEILREARRAAKFSQRELSRRAGVPQAAISRVESGLVSPRFDTLDRLLRACGSEVVLADRAGRGLDMTLISERLDMSPGDRFRRTADEWNRTRVLSRTMRDELER